MSGQLNYAVHLDGPDGHPVCIAPGDDIPKWAVDKIGDHAYEDGQAPKRAKKSEKVSGSSGGSNDGPPPKAGAGSGTEAWAEYAKANGVDVEEGAKRDDIVTALDAAGVPTE